MMSVTHATIAAAGASLILGSADPIVLGLAILGSQLPDLDTTTSAIGQICFPLSSWIEDRYAHRTVTHCLLATVALAVLSLMIGYVLGGRWTEAISNLQELKAIDDRVQVISQKIDEAKKHHQATVKLAEIENKRGDLTAKLRETMVLQVLEFDQIRREFQIAQEIAQREAPRMKVYTFEYQVGGSTTGDYLGRMSALDRQKAEVFRQWAKLRTQLARVKLLMLGAGEE